MNALPKDALPMMSPVLVAPPLDEPVSLAEAKLYLRIDGDDEDDLVTTLVNAARLLVEAASGRQLIAQTWRLTLERWPLGPVRLPLSPVLSVAGARLRGADGQAAAIAGVSGVVIPGSDPPMVLLAAAPTPAPPPGSRIEIDVVAGFGAAADVPAPLRQAILALTARWFEHRGDQTAGPDAALPSDVMALVAPYRRARL
jgi:uncharacterized phiE125 gp8 family phage protein